MRVVIALIFSLLTLTITVAQVEPQIKPKFITKGNEGRITGSVILLGKPPANPRVSVAGDQFCQQVNPKGQRLDRVLVTDGRLANVIVYVHGGPTNFLSFDVPAEPAILNQLNCRFEPHIVALQVKQPLMVTSADNTPHNVHPLPKANQEWNKSQPPHGEAIVERFHHPEIIPIKCNLHPWMKAYIGVFEHPYFAVTDQSGLFELRDLPPGQYSIEAWHETYGIIDKTVTVGENDLQIIELTYQIDTAEWKNENNSLAVGSSW